MRYWLAKRFLHWSLVLMGDSTVRRYLLWSMDNIVKNLEAKPVNEELH